jgi:hypothetical protein
VGTVLASESTAPGTHQGTCLAPPDRSSFRSVIPPDPQGAARRTRGGTSSRSSHLADRCRGRCDCPLRAHHSPADRTLFVLIVPFEKMFPRPCRGVFRLVAGPDTTAPGGCAAGSAADDPGATARRPGEPLEPPLGPRGAVPVALPLDPPLDPSSGLDERVADPSRRRPRVDGRMSTASPTPPVSPRHPDPSADTERVRGGAGSRSSPR